MGHHSGPILFLHFPYQGSFHLFEDTLRSCDPSAEIHRQVLDDGESQHWFDKKALPGLERPRTCLHAFAVNHHDAGRAPGTSAAVVPKGKRFVQVVADILERAQQREPLSPGNMVFLVSGRTIAIGIISEHLQGDRFDVHLIHLV